MLRSSYILVLIYVTPSMRPIILGAIRTPPKRVLRKTKVVSATARPVLLAPKRKNREKNFILGLLQKQGQDLCLKDDLDQQSKLNASSVDKMVIGLTNVQIKEEKFKKRLLRCLNPLIIQQNGTWFHRLIQILNVFFVNNDDTNDNIDIEQNFQKKTISESGSDSDCTYLSDCFMFSFINLQQQLEEL